MSGLKRHLVPLFLLMLAWAAPGWAADGPDKSVIILLDTSGSMRGNGMAMAHAALGRLFEEMEADGEYRLGLIKGTGRNVVVPLGAGTLDRVRSAIGFGGSDGNPTTDLARFAGETLPANPGCHLVLLVTDGDDGSNPLVPARSIKSQCSRLFVVGVNLDSASGAILDGIAQAGGGRFCNGLDAQGLTRCILSVFKPYQFNEALGHCTNVNGIPGLNPMPRQQRLKRLRDWECYDFSNKNFADGSLSQELESGVKIVKSVRGSDFSGANLEKVFLEAPLRGARFNRANLKSAHIWTAAGKTDHVDFSNADLTGATLYTRSKECTRDWNFTGANLTSINLNEFRGCKLQLSGELDQPWIHDSVLQGVKVGNGLKIYGAQGRGLEIAGLSGVKLELERGLLNQVQLRHVEVEKLVLQADGVSRNTTTMSLRDIKATTDMVVAKSGYQRMEIVSLVTPRLELQLMGGARRLKITNSHIGEAELGAPDIELANTRLERVQFNYFEALAILKQSKTGTMTIKPADRATFRVEDSTLGGLAVDGASVWVEARQADLSGSSWRNVTWEKGSSLEEVNLSRSHFEGMELSPVMVDTRLDESSFKHSPIRLEDGSENVTCVRCGDLRVILDTDYMRGLRLSETHTELLVRNPMSELVRLDAGQASLKFALNRNGLICRDCRFERATLQGPFDGLTLINAQAGHAELKGFTFTDKEAIEINGGDFRQATFRGAQTMKAVISKADFSGARFEDVALEAEVSNSLFVDAVFMEGVKGSEILHSDFSKARFPKLGKGVVKSTFIRTKFSGAEFPTDSRHSLEAVFENCWFDGPYGKATIANLLRGARGLKISYASWAGVDLSGINQEGVELVSVDLGGARLVGTGLSRVKLEDVNLAGADLTNGRLQGEISNTSLHRAKVNNAVIDGSLSGSQLTELVDSPKMTWLTAHLEDVDLSGSHLYGVIPVRDAGIPAYRRLTLTDATISCGMEELIRQQKVTTYGGYQALDRYGHKACPEF